MQLPLSGKYNHMRMNKQAFRVKSWNAAWARLSRDFNRFASMCKNSQDFFPSVTGQKISDMFCVCCRKLSPSCWLECGYIKGPLALAFKGRLRECSHGIWHSSVTSSKALLFQRCVCVGLELKRNGMRHKHQPQEIRTGETTTMIRNLKYTFKL